jgi:hypothetical protein
MDLSVERFHGLSYRRILRFDFFQSSRVLECLGGIAGLLQEAHDRAERVTIVRVCRYTRFEHCDRCGGLSGVV